MATRPADDQDVACLLEESSLAHLGDVARHERLRVWANLHRADRPAFLRRLQRIGVAKLSDRQKLANVLSRRLGCADSAIEDVSAQEAVARADQLL
eukprot:6417055-Prymnesium_polylepis.1